MEAAEEEVEVVEAEAEVEVEEVVAAATAAEVEGRARVRARTTVLSLIAGRPQHRISAPSHSRRYAHRDTRTADLASCRLMGFTIIKPQGSITQPTTRPL